jgi:hypothetical protein
MSPDTPAMLDARKIPTLRPGFFTLAFNPFYYIAGMKACGFGVFIIVIAGALGWFSGSHFDGVLDFHTGTTAPLWYSIGEGLMDWLVLALILLISAKMLSRSHGLRAIDVIGTQALARFPTVFVALFALLPGYRRTANMFAPTFDPAVLAKPSADLAVFYLVLLVTIFMIIWMVYLMYRAYASSSNMRGARAIISFIVCLFVAEIISKVFIALIARID